MAKGGADQFANMAVISVTESAANTLTFKKLETGINLFEKLAWIIHRAEYFPSWSASIFNGTDDQLVFGFSTSDQITSVGLAQAACVDFMELRRLDLGTAAAGAMYIRPVVKDFTNLPGGGVIMPPNPIFGFAQGTGLASAASVSMRLFYTNFQMEPAQYWELVEARRLIASS